MHSHTRPSFRFPFPFSADEIAVFLNSSMSILFLFVYTSICFHVDDLYPHLTF